MRRGPGSYLRGRMGRFVLASAVGAGVLLGLVAGRLLRAFGPGGEGLAWSDAGYLVFALVAAWVYFICVGRGVGRWSPDSVLKGFEAEHYTGQVLDYAIAAEGCGVAHGVMSIPGTVGDIDHLVVTPARVLVVETKYGRVPRKYFPRVLGRIARNVKAVREWAGGGVRVEGYLVLGREDGLKLPGNYGSGGERIVACTQSWLGKRIRSDVGGVRVVGEGVVWKVWGLGRVGDEE